MKKNFLYRLWAVLAVLTLTSLACELSLIDLGASPTREPVGGPTATSAPVAEITFTVALPAPLVSGEKISFTVLDEVTGLALNPALYTMQPVDNLHYSIKMPFILGSVIKYRYIRQGAGLAQEDSALGSHVRYRMYHVDAPGSVNDVLASWSDQPYAGSMGAIQGVVSGPDGKPLQNILVMAGGMASVTDTLGQYNLPGLPPGTHHLIAYAMDGSYKTYQHSAQVEADLTTSAPLTLQAAQMVQVTFQVTPPGDTVVGAPVRLAGNLQQLGNTFADLNAGLSTIAVRMPTLSQNPDGKLAVSLRLPAGADIRYKYTLGDGFWNAEHEADGRFVLRQLIVPGTDTVVQDAVYTWQSGPSAPIVFDVNVPANTPVEDNVSIQFNAYGWAEPLPMWPMAGNRWVYKLYSPLDMLGSFGYRYCRNSQCDAADDVATANGSARRVSTSLISSDIRDTVKAWNWWPETKPGAIKAVSVGARSGEFWAGVELQATYHPNWQSFYPPAYSNIQALGANAVIYTPSWTAISSNPLIWEPTPRYDPTWADGVQAIEYSRALNFKTAVFPTLNLLPNPRDFWLRAPRSAAWWEAWFQRYRAFALYHAELAARGNAQILILGGEDILPALPGGIMSDGNPSGVPADAADRWRSIINDVRARFKGQVFWAHPYEDTLPPAPEFIDRLDGFYLLWSAPLGANGTTVEAMADEAARRMDTDLVPFLATARKAVIIGVNYPSASGAATGCVPSGAGCVDWRMLSRPLPDVPTAALDLPGQATLYQALLQAINQRQWVSGFIARGYYPPAALMDKSSSVRGKPAADLLWYWFPRLLGR